MSAKTFPSQQVLAQDAFDFVDTLLVIAARVNQPGEEFAVLMTRSANPKFHAAFGISRCQS
jgi:hypothetical protein